MGSPDRAGSLGSLAVEGARKVGKALYSLGPVGC